MATPVKSSALFAASYSLWLSNPAGVRIKLIPQFLQLQYVRLVNSVGTMTLVLPRTFDRSLLKRDTRLEIWRRIGRKEYLETGTIWLVRKIQDRLGADELIVMAVSALELANRRGIAYAAGTSYAAKTGAADSVIVEIAQENFGSSATDTDRDWSSWLSIQSAAGAGPTIYKAMAWRNYMLEVMQEIAEDAAQAGTPVFFDIVSPSENTLTFRTYTGQRGVDLTSGQKQVKLSPDFGTLTNVVLTHDYTGEYTYVYALGSEQGSNRNTAEASDSDRIAASPSGRIERMHNASNIKTANRLTAEAEAILEEGRPIRLIEGEVQNRPGTQYGIDWNWGDKVLTEIDNEVLTVRIDLVRVTVDRGVERVETRLRVED